MAVSLNNYLRQLSSDYYLKNDSDELKKINNSVENLLRNLDKDLEYLVNRRFIFGSFDRDTILPRKYDSESDVDIMVVFNHTDFERTPETYRGWLKLFADKYYKNRYGSEVVKSFPTVTIRLNNINYDLVPAKEVSNFFSSTLYIPGDSGWISTDPNDVKTNLTNVNSQFNYIVRPIIRLLKAWNNNVGHPVDSYDLELQITKMNFHGDSIESGFIWAAKRITVPYSAAQWKKDRISNLKTTISNYENCLEKADIIGARIQLHKLLPHT